MMYGETDPVGDHPVSPRLRFTLSLNSTDLDPYKWHSEFCDLVSFRRIRKTEGTYPA